uniref:Uncharacterized protein n=1 Tax=Anguilla anguilla TaxID=7936 RepID=A0A0E9X7Q6_ANGAN
MNKKCKKYSFWNGDIQLL